MRIKSLFLTSFFLVFAANAYAALKIDITQGQIDPVPIAINNFYDENGRFSQLGEQIKLVIENDLKSSGIFRIINSTAFLENITSDQKPSFSGWRQIGSIAFTSGKITRNQDKITVEFRLWDSNAEAQIEGKSFTLTEKSYRRVAHKIADQIYQRLTGESGYFDTRVVFVSESGPLNHRIKKLAIMDSDSANYKELTSGKYLVLTPRFDTKSQKIIYMSYQDRIPGVYLLDLQSGNQELIGKFSGISFAPRFSPNGQKAIMSVASNGTTNIYELDLASKSKTKLTSGLGTIDTSPSYSPDGASIIFASDRGGKTQLYTMSSDGSNVKRVSFGDGTYSSPVWSPRGDFIAFSKLKGGQHYIGVMRPDGTGERLLTTSWMDEGPTWSPNGRVIMFSRQTKNAGYSIYSVDITGGNEHKTSTPGDASDPAWSPLL